MLGGRGLDALSRLSSASLGTDFNIFPKLDEPFDVLCNEDCPILHTTWAWVSEVVG